MHSLNDFYKKIFYFLSTFQNINFHQTKRNAVSTKCSQTINRLPNTPIKYILNSIPELPLSTLTVSGFFFVRFQQNLRQLSNIPQFPLLPQYSSMQQPPKSDLQSCDCEEQFEVLLSQRMHALEPSIQAKSLLSLQHISSTSIPSPDKPKTFLTAQKERFLQKTLKNPKNCANKSRTKPSGMKRTSAGNRERLSLMESVRLFEISEGSQGRKPMMTEVRGLRVSEFTGRGLLLLPSGKKYEGEWVQGNLIGEARITYPNGDIYQGQVYNYQQHGRGFLYYISGEKFEGEFSGGDFHGEGVFYDKEGKIKYEGEWKRGKIVEQ